MTGALAGLLLLSLLDTASPSGAPSSLQLDLIVRLAPPEVWEGKRWPTRIALDLLARSRDRSGDALEVAGRLESVGSSGTARATLRVQEGTWTVRLKSDGYWAPPKTVSVRPSRQNSVELFVFPAVKIVARATFKPITNPGRTLGVSFRGSSDVPLDRRIPEGSAYCSLDDRRALCTLPAGRLDLRFEAQGRIPVYLWRRDIHPRAEVGPLSFETGGSIIGYVRNNDESIVPGTRLQLLTVDGEPVATTARKEVETQANEDGFFQFRAIAPGSYQVLGSDVHGCAGAGTVTVEPESEARLNHSLELGKPVALGVTVEPPLPPTGGRWRLALIRFPSATQTLERLVPVTGRTQLKPVSRGDYSLEVWSGSRRYAAKDLVVDGTPGPIVLKLSPVKVFGAVKLGKRPLPSRVTFGFMGEREQLDFQADERGHFEGHLPRAGQWNVQVESDAPQVVRRLRGVEVKTDNSGEARIELNLPEGLLRGRVVAENGAAKRVLVNVAPTQAGDAGLRVWSRDDGTFEFHGLPPGLAYVSAGVGFERTDAVAVVLVDGAAQEVVLTLTKGEAIDGGVASARGEPVAGVRITARPTGQPRSIVASATSDIDGSFNLTLPAGTQDLEIVYASPELGVRMGRASVPQGGQLPLAFGDGIGTLLFDLPPDLDLTATTQSIPALIHDGVDAPLRQLLEMAQVPLPERSAGPWQVSLPRVGVGEYQLCLVDRAAFLANAEVLPFGTPCASGVLAPDGQLQLSVPSASGSR